MRSVSKRNPPPARETPSSHASRPAARAEERARPRPSVFPPAAELWDPRGPYLVPLALLLVTRVATWLMLPQASEDAYITFRYARSLASGSGLVYNPGERVMGFSSPLWTIWNALGYAVLHQPLLWSRATSLAADAVTLLTLGGLLARQASAASARCFTVFFALWPYFPAVGMSGLE